MKALKTLLIIVLISLLLSCVSEQLRVVASQDKGDKNFLIGYIENRGTRFSPFTTKNFVDMLKFELLKEGFLITSLPPHAIQKLCKKRKDMISSNTVPRNDSITNLLPVNIKDFAKNQKTVFDIKTELNIFLTKKEITKLAKDFNFDYILQGSISVRGTNDILEEEDNSLLFLEIIDKKGRQAGVINFYVEGKSLNENPYLQRVSANISRGIRSKILK